MAGLRLGALERSGRATKVLVDRWGSSHALLGRVRVVEPAAFTKAEIMKGLAASSRVIMLVTKLRMESS